MTAEDGGGGIEQERRLEERSDCDIEARVELSDRLAIACRVTDLSASGFKIQIADAIHLPDEFDLLIPVIEGVFQRYQVRMVWRTPDTVGGTFISPQRNDLRVSILGGITTVQNAGTRRRSNAG